MRFIETIAVELRETGIEANAVAPGPVLTRMNEERIAAGPEQAGEEVWRSSLQRKEQQAGNPELCAQLCVFLASAASDGLSGKLISAVWDNWHRFPERLAALQTSDVYTLRRIVPADRGLNWPPSST